MSLLHKTLLKEMESIPKGKNNQFIQIYLKEVLQSHILSFIYNSKKYQNLVLYGGTCLRLCYGLNRMSEDLDFDNSETLFSAEEIKTDIDVYLRNRFQNENHSFRIQKSENSITRLILKFPVLFDLGISANINNNLHLRLDLSNHDQVADIVRTPLFRHGQSFVIRHFSEESLMAGKIIAAIERSYKRGKDVSFKARDYYDLIWLMQQKIIPDQKKLSLDGKESYSQPTAFIKIGEMVREITPQMLNSELEQLFEDTEFIRIWAESFQDNFLRFVKHYQ
jgi:predicted nucleotidyltransferase component of viral defense system